MSRRPGLSFQHETQRGYLAVTALLFKKKHAKEQAEKQKHSLIWKEEGKKGAIFLCRYQCAFGMQVCDLLFVCVHVTGVDVPSTLPGGCRWHDG